ncbi:hypothetical protein ACIA49_39120 [Kribbella sp. NPDC051587]|uniref:hypothetical protein n=1 Tax=Kribbella sp. NPDC051587 TaxID=3364119 RepID=UPI0037A21255
MSSTPEDQLGKAAPIVTDEGVMYLVRRQPVLELHPLPEGIIPSAERTILDPLPDFLFCWEDTTLLEKIVPQLSCGEADTLAQVLEYAGAPAQADEVRAIHLEHQTDPCMLDHNTGCLIE